MKINSSFNLPSATEVVKQNEITKQKVEASKGIIVKVPEVLTPKINTQNQVIGKIINISV